MAPIPLSAQQAQPAGSLRKTLSHLLCRMWSPELQEFAWELVNALGAPGVQSSLLPAWRLNGAQFPKQTLRRPRANLVNSASVTWTLTESPINNEVQISAATVSSGASVAHGEAEANADTTATPNALKDVAGCAVSLPAAGTYYLYHSAFVAVSDANAGSFLQTNLLDVGAGAAVPNSAARGLQTFSGVTTPALTISSFTLYTVSGATTVKMQCFLNSPSGSATGVVSHGDPGAKVGFLKVA